MTIEIQNNDINNYILRCTEKIEFHKNNAINASIWNNFLSTTSIFLSALTAFSMTILTVFETPTESVTVAGSTYALLITIINKLKDSYNFLALSHQHYSLMDQYAELKVDLQRSLNDDSFIESRIALIYKYTIIEQKSHIQTVKCSNCLRCCINY